jgi:type I restriction enzyme S subunit
MPEPIDISPKDLVIVRAILSHYVPEYEVRAFGSRVAWTAKENSDLDLAVMTDKPLKATLFVDLKDAFTDSDLSIKVDVVDWAKTGANFRKIIEGKYVVVQKAEQQTTGSYVDGEWKPKLLADVLVFSNGKSSPARSSKLTYPVYGSNGIIGYADDSNADPGTVVIGRVGSYCGSLYYCEGKSWVTDNAIRANAIDENDSKYHSCPK